MAISSPFRRKRKQGSKGRPFPKGVCPNPKGRPRKELAARLVEIDVRRYCRENGREAVDRMIELMRGKAIVDAGTADAPKPTVVMVGAATMLSAAVEILDRGYGKPAQSVEIAGKDGGPIITENTAYDIIRSRLDGIAQRLREGDAPTRLN